MNIEKDLKKDGITVIKPLDTLSITLIAKYVAEKLISALPFYGLNYHNLFIKISNTPMFIADIPSSMGEASYFYKNSSIYFKNGLSIHEMKRYAVHEFIHAYQEVKDKNNLLYRLGLCDFTGFRVHGMALNEAAVQLIAAKALNNDVESVKYYDIEFNTNTPSLYPIICNLVNQLSYITGENILFDSTLNSNFKFVKSLISLLGEKSFYKINANLDKIIKIEEKMVSLSNKLEKDFLSDTFIANASTKIGIYKNSIKNIFFETQNLIIKSYFDRALSNVYSLQEIEDYRKKLYHYRDLLGTTENYTFFNDYYINMMIKLDEKYEAVSNIELALVPYTRSIFEIILQKIRALIGIKRTRNGLYKSKIKKCSLCIFLFYYFFYFIIYFLFNIFY
ncbi:MAG: hypothetical protein HFJ41_01180 [Clostridia bacterium]|nr:hypothetical protein [Clostridia bacterium]